MNKRGFSRTEILIVLAILVALVFYAFNNFSSAVAKSRDAERLKELNELSRALELYYDLNKMYPCGDTFEEDNSNNNIGGTYDLSFRDCPSSNLNTRGFLNGFGIFDCSGDLLEYSSLPGKCGVKPAGLFDAGILSTNRPHDPKSNDSNPPYFVYSYHVSPDRQSYVLASYLEKLKKTMISDGGSCSHYYEIGNALGSIKPWKDIVCGCDGSKEYDICK